MKKITHEPIAASRKLSLTFKDMPKPNPASNAPQLLSK
jgi:hypothetical protein